MAFTITTQFAPGDEVHGIRSQQVKVWTPCAFCASSGHVSGANGHTRSCPECYGGTGRDEWLPEAWRYVGRMTVGQVRVEVDAGHVDERYMLVETGVGSGTLWKVADLFRSVRSAKGECKRRNP